MGEDALKVDELNEKLSRAEAVIKKAYVVHPNYDHICAALLEVGLEGLADRLSLTVGECLLLHVHLGKAN